MLAPDWFKCIRWPNIPVKTGEYPRIKFESYSPIFKTYRSSKIKVFCNFIQDERTFCDCSRGRNMFVHKILPENIKKWTSYVRFFKGRCKNIWGIKNKITCNGAKYARLLVYGHYLFVKAHSFLRASLSEKPLQRVLSLNNLHQFHSNATKT